jgi:hypothetical protein
MGLPQALGAADELETALSSSYATPGPTFIEAIPAKGLR